MPTPINHALYLASQHPNWFAALGFCTALILYWIRERLRLLYAVVEIAAGIAALWTTTPTFIAGFSNEFDGADFAQSDLRLSYVTIAGALYFIVRGLDNLDKALSKHSIWIAIMRSIGLPKVRSP